MEREMEQQRERGENCNETWKKRETIKRQESEQKRSTDRVLKTKRERN